jgi:secreted trypsin-like serine protease
LTAAHCFRDTSGTSNKDTPTSNLYVGSTTKFSELPNNKQFKVKKYTVHPTYTSSGPEPQRADIAVIEFENEISFDSSKKKHFSKIQKIQKIQNTRSDTTKQKILSFFLSFFNHLFFD